MKITIYAPEPPYTNDAHICINGTNKRLQNSNSGIKQTEFTDDEIHFLIGHNEFSKYETGKYEFDVPKWKLDTVQGMANPKNKEQLKYSYNWASKNY